MFLVLMAYVHDVLIFKNGLITRKINIDYFK